MRANDYFVKCEYLFERIPDHPLRERLEARRTLLNVSILESELQKLKESLSVEHESPPSSPKMDRPLKVLYSKWNNYLRQRNEISNQLHTLKTTIERRPYVDRILDLIKRMGEISQQIDHYIEFKELPELPKSEEYEIPETVIDLYKKRSSLRSSISQATKRLEKHKSLGLADKVERGIAKIQKLKIHLAYVERHIAIKTI